MYVETRIGKLEGSLQMKHDDEQMKNVSWEFGQKKYIIYNVPFHEYAEYSNEGVYDSDTTLKLLMLKELMEAKEIPSKIDFQESMDIVFE